MSNETKWQCKCLWRALKWKTGLSCKCWYCYHLMAEKVTYDYWNCLFRVKGQFQQSYVRVTKMSKELSLARNLSTHKSSRIIACSKIILLRTISSKNSVLMPGNYSVSDTKTAKLWLEESMTAKFPQPWLWSVSHDQPCETTAANVLHSWSTLRLVLLTCNLDISVE